MQQTLTTLAKNPQEAYRRQNVLTASPIELIIMLYDGLRKNIILAQRAINKRDMDSSNKYLIKAQNIVSELMNCLDLSFQISEELMRIYDFLFRGLVDSNIKKNADNLPDYLSIVDELRGAWSEVNSLQKTSPPPEMELGQQA
ncbi:MAG: flagellar export chaperone FliS [Oscillospiraceae bacterium]|jgi:flagellar protein FliS|nr:flagellar export chaperone FliS [Oscillospiraceae bacterium]